MGLFYRVEPSIPNPSMTLSVLYCVSCNAGKQKTKAKKISLKLYSQALSIMPEYVIIFINLITQLRGIFSLSYSSSLLS